MITFILYQELQRVLDQLEVPKKHLQLIPSSGVKGIKIFGYVSVQDSKFLPYRLNLSREARKGLLRFQPENGNFRSSEKAEGGAGHTTKYRENSESKNERGAKRQDGPNDQRPNR
jgi:hypothetical protein